MDRYCAARVAIWAVTVLTAVVLLVPVPRAEAQGVNACQGLKAMAKDPTTWGPAIVTWTGAKLDWDTSQPLFGLGFIEQNPRYTASGLPSDLPKSYRSGNRMVAAEAGAVLGISMAHNTVVHAFAARAAKHRWLRVTFALERLAFAVVATYVGSAAHWRQWQRNVRTLRALS